MNKLTAKDLIKCCETSLLSKVYPDIYKIYMYRIKARFDGREDTELSQLPCLDDYKDVKALAKFLNENSVIDGSVIDGGDIDEGPKNNREKKEEAIKYFFKVLDRETESLVKKISGTGAGTSSKRHIFRWIMIPIVIVLIVAALVLTVLGATNVLDEKISNTVSVAIGATDFVLAGIFFIYEQLSDSKKAKTDGAENLHVEKKEPQIQVQPSAGQEKMQDRNSRDGETPEKQTFGKQILGKRSTCAILILSLLQIGLLIALIVLSNSGPIVPQSIRWWASVVMTAVITLCAVVMFIVALFSCNKMTWGFSLLTVLGSGLWFLLGQIFQSMNFWRWFVLATCVICGLASAYYFSDWNDSSEHKKSALWGMVSCLALGGLFCAGAFMAGIEQAMPSISEGFYYRLKEDGTVTAFVEDYDMEELVIPALLDGKRVTEIAAPVKRRDAYAMKKIELPDGLISLGEDAFRGCTQLTSVTLPASLQTIEAHAFENCYSLSEIRFETAEGEIGNLYMIGEGAFCNCNALKQIYLPDSVKTLQAYAFEGCSLLSDVRLSESLNELCEGVFQNCISLKEIYLPSSITYIREKAFKGCSLLSQVRLAENVYFKSGILIFPSDGFDFTDPQHAAKILREEIDPFERYEP